MGYRYRNDEKEGRRVELGDVEGLEESGFDPTIQTKVIVHGYEDSYLGDEMQETKDGELSRIDCFTKFQGSHPKLHLRVDKFDNETIQATRLPLTSTNCLNSEFDPSNKVPDYKSCFFFRTFKKK